MIELVILFGSMVYAGFKAQKEHVPKTAAAPLAQAATAGLPAVVNRAPVANGSSTKFQDEYQEQGDHYFRVAALATGVSVVSTVFAPAGLIAFSLLTYLGIPVFKNAYTSIFIERKPRSSVIKSAAWAVGLLSGLSVLASLGSLAYFASFRLMQRTEQRLRGKLGDIFTEAPGTVWVMHGEVEVEVAFDAVSAGDVMVLEAGDAIPVDGKVLRGSAVIDARTPAGAMQTQELLVGELVFASTPILSGKIYVEALQSGAATRDTIRQRLLEQSAGLKTATESRAVRNTDELATPTLLAGAAGGVLMGPLNGVALLSSNMSDINLLTASLGMLNHLEIALDQGVLIKCDGDLERLAEVDTVVFDYPGFLALGTHPERAALRPEAHRVVRELAARKLELVLLSAEAEDITRERAQQLGIARFHAATAPAEKGRIIEDLRRHGHKLCFIGAGIDPALRLPEDVVAIGLRGEARNSLQAADIVLLDGSFEQLVSLFELAQELGQTQRYDAYASAVPGIASAVGVVFFGLGMSASFSLYLVGLGAGMGNAMLPKLKQNLAR